MKCKQCNNDLMITSVGFESALDTEEITSVQKLVCTNVNCQMFCGNDTNNPTKIAEVIRTKV